jgi:hypothetical protein
MPKCLKTWLAIELAVAVASGTKALGRFQVHSGGPVLAFAAEDDLTSMRKRIHSVARARAVPFEDLQLFLIDVGSLFLDDPLQLASLRATIKTLRPRLLILDPFVRIARVDENSAQEVSALLGSLRAIQRDFDLAVVLVHHLRKSPSANLGQQLRGSGDFAAWYDSGLYLVREGERLRLHAEHRAAPAPPTFFVRLDPGETPHLIVEDHSPLAASGDKSALPLDALDDAVLSHLRSASRPVPTDAMREALSVRKASLLDALRRLHAAKRIRHTPEGWLVTQVLVPGSQP